jgi:hypothetical protein
MRKSYPSDISAEQFQAIRALLESIGHWGQFDLMALLTEQAQYLGQPLRDCAPKLTTVEVPWDRKHNQGWLWHPWLGFKEKQ